MRLHGRASQAFAVALVEKPSLHANAFAQSASEAFREALSHKGYVLLTIGFFVRGFRTLDLLSCSDP